MAPGFRQKSNFWKAVARELLAVDAFIDTSVYNVQRRAIRVGQFLVSASDRLRLTGISKVALDLTCEAVNLGIIGLIVAVAFAMPSYRDTADEDWLKRTDLAVTFLDRHG